MIFLIVRWFCTFYQIRFSEIFFITYTLLFTKYLDTVIILLKDKVELSYLIIQFEFINELRVEEGQTRHYSIMSKRFLCLLDLMYE